MISLLALWQNHVSQWSIIDFLVLVIIIGGCVGITIVALRASGVQIPAWATQIFWIVIIVFVAIFAIRLLASM